MKKTLEESEGPKYFEKHVLIWPEGEPAPEIFTHQGKMFYRFMDKFLVSRLELDELEFDEMSELCRAREKYPGVINSANERVKCVFREMIARISPTAVLEIGAGARPLYEIETGFTYIKADADVDSMAGVSGRKEQFITRIAVPDCSIDVAVAVFVFHFRIYSQQIEEISRILSSDGVLLVNIYRRSSASRDILRDEFAAKGLVVKGISDMSAGCKDHEYWVVAKNCRVAETRMSMLSKLI